MIDFRLIRHLHAFVVLAEELHFGRAAKRLGISQPPLTQQIQTLEQSLGVRLFERSRRGVQLTANGATILPTVQRLMEQAERVEVTVRDTRAGKTRLVHVGSILSAMYDMLPNTIRAVQQAYPDVALSITEIDSFEAIESLESGSFDIAFARLDRGRGDVQVRELKKERLAVALPANHALAARKNVDLADLASEPLILFSRRVSPALFDKITSACVVAGFAPQIVHETKSIAAQIAMVGCGLGPALIPDGFALQGISGVVFRPLVQHVDLVTVAVAWNAKLASPAVLAMVDLATRVANGGV